MGIVIQKGLADASFDIALFLLLIIFHKLQVFSGLSVLVLELFAKLTHIY